MKDNENKIDITPSTAIYTSFRRLPYSTEGAIAEFVDNSTQSFYDHEQELKDYEKRYFGKDYKLEVNILYQNSDGVVGNNDVLRIVDNAYGMSREIFIDRVLKLDIENRKENSRNEFGMGLKTSAFWFADVLEIMSTNLENGVQYSTKLDLDILKETKEHLIDLTTTQSTRDKHGTTIKLTKIDQRIKGKKQREKLVEKLSNIYREELSDETIILRFAEFYPRDLAWKDANGVIYASGKEDKELGYLKVPPLKFTKPDLLMIPKKTLDNPSNFPREAKTVFDDCVEFDGKKYPIKGWVGVLAKGKREITGFALLRLGRVIQWNYQPKEIFGSSNSFQTLRIIGEVSMDNFPVIQSKEGFNWNNGLEEEFIKILQKNSAKMVDFAMKWRQTEPVTDDALPADSIAESSKNFVTNMNNGIVEEKSDWKIKKSSSKGVDYSYKEKNKEKSFRLELNYEKDPKKWIDVMIPGEDSIVAKVYLNHNFLKPNSAKKEFLSFIKQFSEAYALAYVDGMTNNSDLTIFGEKFNEYLSNLSLNK